MWQCPFASLGCYLDLVLFNKAAHSNTAKRKTRSKGHRFCKLNPWSVSSLYPQDAGKIFPTVANGRGSNSDGNIIPESITDGKNASMENRGVLAWSFTHNPIMLAILRDTAIKMARSGQYCAGVSGILASKASGARK